MTSHDVVARARRGLGTRKVGHAGTLDPLATGLLVLGIEGATRLLTYLVGLDKEYLATIVLGAASSTDDIDGELGERAAASALDAVSASHVVRVVESLTGHIRQRPSSVSAIKVDGKRAYARARAGEEVVLAERDVVVSAFEVIERRRTEWVELDVRIECSSGTYVRALARDLGEALGVGGHISALRRTRVGPLAVAEASDLDADLAAAVIDPALLAARLFPVLQLTATQALDLSHGKAIAMDAPPGTRMAALSPAGHLVGLVESREGRSRVLMNLRS